MITYRQPFKGSYQITQRFGETMTDPKGHSGIDFDCPEGTEILASAAGTVRFAGWDPTGYGNCVIIQHSANRSTLYAHLQKVLVKTLQSVDQGQVIGLSGYTGNVVPEGSTGRHLHFEARETWNKYGTAFDPMLLPLSTVDDSIGTAYKKAEQLKNAADLKSLVKVVAPLGAKAWDKEFRKYDYFPCGEKLDYTGRTMQRNGLTFCEVYPSPRSYWVAVHDGSDQILDNRGE
ncbi:MAG: M23 family metallopeptidase [Anaerolineaceae bacterium]|nr:M23 family metallopeptidase [Anaerolineaceae bacterium]